MTANKAISITNFYFSSNSFRIKLLKLILVFLSGVIIFPFQQAKSEEIFLKCTGKYEINKGELIKPDWETSYVKINLNGLTSQVVEKSSKIEGRTSIRRNSYTITHRDKRNRVKTKYKINDTYGTYIVERPQLNRTLIGTCQKGRG